MADNMNGEAPLAPPDGPKPKSPVVVFLTSSTGRLIIGGAILFVVVVIAGALTFFFLVNSGGPVVVVTPPPSGSSKPASPTAPPVSPPEAGLKETFTFRNIFAPTVEPPVAPTSATSSTTATASTEPSGSTTTSSTTSGAEDTLILKSIATDNGVKVATFEWNGANYECVEGDTVDDSPWKVVKINSDSVLMLYGDSQVTLTVGQGFSKNPNKSISK
jgi:type IV pilus biogenesis protein PilP